MISINAGYGINILNGNMYSSSNTGMLRWNGMNQNVEIMTNTTDGYSPAFIPLPYQQYTINLDPIIMNAVNWVMIQQAEENRFNTLSEKHPGLKLIRDEFSQLVTLIQKLEDEKINLTLHTQRLESNLEQEKIKTKTLTEQLDVWTILAKP